MVPNIAGLGVVRILKFQNMLFQRFEMRLDAVLHLRTQIEIGDRLSGERQTFLERFKTCLT